MWRATSRTRGKFVLLIDYMLASWQHHEALDPFRVGMFGFSAGGFTALVAIGGTPDMSTVAPHCAAHLMSGRAACLESAK
jgi:predicted dienelactone hydrolase